MAYTPATPLDAVEALYIGYFGRAGEPGGVQYWVNQIQQGRTFAQVAAAFSVQAEAKAQHPFLANPSLVNPGDFVESLYQQLFGRASDAAGKAYWVAQLSAANGNPFAYGLIVAQFISGAQNSADGQDLTVIQNKVVAAEYFTQKLAAAGIQGTDANGQVTPTTDAAATDVISGVTKDASSIDASKAKTDAFVSGGNTGSTFTFTNQVDNLNGTQGNDTFLGDGTSASAADTANGGSGIDTVKLLGLGGSFLPQLNSVENVYIGQNTAAGNFDISTKAGVQNIEFNQIFTGTTATIGAAQTVTVSDSAKAADATVNVAGAASVTTLGLTLSGNGSDTSKLVVDTTGLAGATTINLASNGTATNYAQLTTAAATTTLNITGSAKADLDAAALSNAITTIDASKATGGAEVAIGNGNVKYIGGSGTDKVTLQAITAADSIDGDGGTADRIVSGINQITKANGAGIKGFEILEVTNGAVQDIDNLIANNTFTGVVFSGGTTTVTNVNTAALSGLSASVDNTAINISAKSFIAGGISDTATFTFADTVENAGGVDAGTITFTNVDVLNLASKSDGTVGGSSSADYATATIVATDLDVLNLSGDEYQSITIDATTASLTVIDGSTSTGGFAVNASAAAITSLNIKGSDAVSTATLRLADTINASNAATSATIQAGKGGDTITVESSAADVIKLLAGDSLVGQTNGANNYDTINGFTTASASTIDVSGIAGFTGSQATVIDRSQVAANPDINATTLAVSATAAANFFVDLGNVNRGVAIVDLNGTGTAGSDYAVYFDVNHNGAWDAATDMVIRVNNVGTALTAAEFTFA